MSTAAIIIVDPDENYSPTDYTPHVGYVLVYTDPDQDDTIPDSPAEDGEWLAVFRNTKPLNKVLFRAKVKDILEHGSNIDIIAVKDDFWLDELWELPMITPKNVED